MSGETTAAAAAPPAGAPPAAAAPGVTSRQPSAGKGLLTTSLLSGISTVARVGAGFLLTKIAAVVLGPSGVGLMGQFGSFAAMVGAFAGGGINHGVTRYMAEYGEAGAEQRVRLLRTAVSVAIASALAIGAGVVLLRRPLAAWLFGDGGLTPVLLVFAAALTFVGLQGVFLAALNGAKEIPTLVRLQVTGSIGTLALGSVLVVRYGLVGALLTVAVGQSLVYLLVHRAVLGRSWYRPEVFRPVWDPEMLRRLGSYTAMAIATAITLPLSHIVIRNHLARSFSWEAAGYWQGVWQVSDGYLMLVTTTLGVYYLPRLAELGSNAEVRAEILRGYRLLLPPCVVLAWLIYLLRAPIVSLLYSEQFLPMTDLFAMQMVGDVLKIGSWLLSYLMVARAMTRLYIVTEVLFSAAFVGLTFALTPRLGLAGVTHAFALAYLGYFVFLLWRFREYVLPRR